MVTNRERVLSVIAGKEVDHAPAGFWFHFPASARQGDEAVRKHLEFARATDQELFKIMTESLMPRADIRRAADWRSLRPFRRDDPFILAQLDVIRRILDGLPEDKVVLTTVHGVWASMFHILNGPDDYEARRTTLAAHLREDPAAFRYGLDVVAEGLQYMIEAMLAEKVDGVFYAALGGERGLLTDDEFARELAAREIPLLRSARDGRRFVVLHMCKDHLNLSRYRDYPCDVVNWGVCSDNPGLTEGAEIFRGRAVLGGLDDRDGLMVHGSPEEIRAGVFHILDEMRHVPFLLGSDCTLPTDVSLDRIRVAVQAARDYPRMRKGEAK